MFKDQLAREVKARRTFAIISHPDAGKTTMTEKLLLWGKAIQVAGMVKAVNLIVQLHLTGWKWKKNVVFRSPRLLCSSHIRSHD